jgi:hypothetical protein
LKRGDGDPSGLSGPSSTLCASSFSSPVLSLPRLIGSAFVERLERTRRDVRVVMSSTSKRPRRKYTQRIVRDMVWVERVSVDESAVLREKRIVVLQLPKQLYKAESLTHLLH